MAVMSGLLRFAHGVVIVAALFVFASFAQAANGWMLIQSIGEVEVLVPGAKPVAAKPSTPVPDGSTIRTGSTGRAVLLRGRETIVMSPSSVVTLPTGANRDVSQVKQQSGTLLFKVGKKPEAHFEVNTPYLAAVVKGTTFTVKVSSAGASVHVLEGAVEVVTVDRKHSFLTRAGQISSVFAKAANDIFTTGASVLNSPSGSGELWGTDISGFEFGGESQDWSFTPQTKTFGDTGLRASPSKPEKHEELSERAPEKFAAAAKAVNETMSASARRHQTARPNDGTVKVTGAPSERDGQREKPEKPDPAAKDRTSGNDKKKTAKKEPPASGDAIAARKAANLWTVTQAKGGIEIDGYPFTNFADGLVRSLPPGTKVETGPDGRLGVAFGVAEFVIEENALVVLGDPSTDAKPKVVEGRAVTYKQEKGRYEAVENLSPDEIAELRSRGELDDAASPEQAEIALREAAAATLTGVNATGPTTSMSKEAAAATQTGVNATGPITSMPKIVTMSAPVNPKTEEVRTKVLGGLTLGLYALTALLVLAFGARWMWTRYRAKAKEPAPETMAQARLRNIKGT